METKLIESSLSRIYHYVVDLDAEFGVISAFKEYNPLEVNLQKHELLRKDIIKLGYGYIEQNSGYSYEDEDTKEEGIRDEKSFFVPHLGFSSTMELGRKYDQESVLIKDESVFGLYMCRDESLGMVFKKKGSVYSFSLEDVKIAYSALIKANHSQRVKFCYLAEMYLPTRTDAYLAMKTRKLPVKGWRYIKEFIEEDTNSNILSFILNN